MGISAGYVADTTSSGNWSFKKISQQVIRIFDMNEDQGLPFVLTGFSMTKDREGSLAMDRHEYLKELEELPLDSSFSHFRSMRMRLARLSNTRPDWLFDIAQLAQITEIVFMKTGRS